jgi:hypothetical protein
MQAMLNFASAIVTARLTRAIVAMGLDPCFGFLHDGRKPGRHDYDRCREDLQAWSARKGMAHDEVARQMPTGLIEQKRGMSA